MQGTIYRIAKRYAKGLWSYTEDPADAEKNYTALNALAEAIESSEELKTLLSSYNFTWQQKAEVILALAQKLKAPEDIKNFLKFLGKEGRLEILPQIVELFRELLNKAQGLIPVRVESALKLSERDKDNITKFIQKKTAKKAQITNEISPELIGGLRIRYEDKVVEASMRANLEKFERMLNSAEAS